MKRNHPPPSLTSDQRNARFREILLDITETGREFAQLLLRCADRAAARGADQAAIDRLTAASRRNARGARMSFSLANRMTGPTSRTPLVRLDDRPRPRLPPAIEALKRDIEQTREDLAKPVYKARTPKEHARLKAHRANRPSRY